MYQSKYDHLILIKKHCGVDVVDVVDNYFPGGDTYVS